MQNTGVEEKLDKHIGEVSKKTDGSTCIANTSVGIISTKCNTTTALHPVSFSNYGSQTPTQIAKHGGIL
jgi:hypothetical protein